MIVGYLGRSVVPWMRRGYTTAAALKPAELRAAVFQPSFDMEKMTALLDHDNHEMRAKFRKFVDEPLMIPRYNISMAEERELALKRLKVFSDRSSF